MGASKTTTYTQRARNRTYYCTRKLELDDPQQIPMSVLDQEVSEPEDMTCMNVTPHLSCVCIKKMGKAGGRVLRDLMDADISLCGSIVRP